MESLITGVMENRCRCSPSLQKIAIGVDNVWLGELCLDEINDIREIALSSEGPV
jgi:hypothetical protein